MTSRSGKQMISQSIQLCRSLLTASCILLSHLSPQIFESISGLLIILLMSFTVIPHGALDHIVFYELYHTRHFDHDKKQSSNLAWLMPRIIFYFHYLSIMVLWSVSWQYQTSFTFLIFLALSAYHFGEGDLDYIQLKSIYQQVLYLSRGAFILSLAILTRPQSTISIVERFIKVPDSSYSYAWLHGIMVCQHFILLAAFAIANLLIDLKDSAVSQFPIIKQEPNTQVWIYELLKSAMFWILFNSMNPLVGFIVYLGPWHSIGHMLSEISSLKQSSSPEFSPIKKVEWSDLARFLYLTAPFTLIALLSMTGAYLLAFGLHSITLVDVNAWAVFVVSISVLTGPHLWVVAAMHYEAVDLDPLMIKDSVSWIHKTLAY